MPTLPFHKKANPNAGGRVRLSSLPRLERTVLTESLLPTVLPRQAAATKQVQLSTLPLPSPRYRYAALRG